MMKSSVSLTDTVMKQENKDIAIVALMALLILSVILNWLQSEQSDRLIEQIEAMEYYQQVLSSHVDELENMEGAEYGNE